MKEIVLKNLWAVVILLFATIGFGQNPIRYQNLSEVPELPKGLLPDANLYGGPFFDWSPKQQKWIPRAGAGQAYAEIFRHVGHANFTPEQALAYVMEKRQDSLYTALNGYPGSLCNGAVSYDRNTPTGNMSGYFICRLDDYWSLYEKDGCGNPTPVPDTIPKKLVPKGVEECTWEIINNYKEVVKPCPPPVTTPPPPCDNCCPEDIVYYKQFPYLTFEFERTGGKLEKWLGVGYEWQRYSAHKGKENAPWVERILSMYGGVAFYLSQQNEVVFKPTCDTCGTNWIPYPDNTSLDLRLRLYGGMQWRISKKPEIFLFTELGYDPYNSRNKRNEFLSDEGIQTKLGIRGIFNLPKKLVLFRSVKVETGIQANTFATPVTEKLAVGAGGFLNITAIMGAREEAIRIHEDSVRRERAHEQFVRDTVRRHERDSIDQIRLDSFLVNHPDTVNVNINTLDIDSTYADKAPQKVWFLEMPVMPWSDQGKVQKENRLKTKVKGDLLVYNDLHEKAEAGQIKWPEMKKHLKKLRKAERKLTNFQKREAKREARKAKRKANLPTGTIDG